MNAIARSALAATLASGLLMSGAKGWALTYQITPVNLVASGTSFTGTVETDGTLGAITAANMVDWNVAVSGPLNFTITPANSGLNPTVFKSVLATTTEILVAFPDGNFQFNLLEPFTTTVPACANCEESSVQLFRSDFGRNAQGFSLRDLVDGDPSFGDFQGPVVAADAEFYVAATRTEEVPIPEPSAALVFAIGALLLGRLRKR